MIKSERITILTKKYNQMIVITGQVEEIVRNSGIKDGVVFIITNHTTTGITVNEGLECIQSDIMETAGGVNAVEGVDVLGDFAEVSAEEIIAWNPEVIWIPAYADYTVDDVLNAPEFSSVAAVQNGAVYSFPSALEPWDYPTASACLGVCWAAYNLHPDLYSYEELIEDVNALYDLIYGQTFTEEQIGIVQ